MKTIIPRLAGHFKSDVIVVEFTELQSALIEKDRLINLIFHCFDMHDYPEIEAKPYILELAKLMGHEFDCLMANPHAEKEGMK